jgi:hypothetical protein
MAENRADKRDKAIRETSTKAWEKNVFEDKLSPEQMADAENRYIEESSQWETSKPRDKGGGTGRKIETAESLKSIRLRRILQTRNSESRDLLRQVALASIPC